MKIGPNSPRYFFAKKKVLKKENAIKAAQAWNWENPTAMEGFFQLLSDRDTHREKFLIKVN